MPVAQKDHDPSKYINKDVLEDFLEDDLFEDDDENVTTPTNRAVQSGWEAALRSVSTGPREYVKDFRFTEEPQVVKFLDNAPFAVFMQHWVQRPGRKSFVSPLGPDMKGDISEDPLASMGLKPTKKAAFSVVNLSLEEPTLQMLTVTTSTVGTMIARLNDDPKTGPLDRMYWSLSKTGSQKSVSHSILPIKPRDLLEDWGIDPDEADRACARFEPLSSDAIRPATYEQLLEIARELDEHRNGAA